MAANTLCNVIIHFKLDTNNITKFHKKVLWVILINRRDREQLPRNIFAAKDGWHYTFICKSAIMVEALGRLYSTPDMPLTNCMLKFLHVFS